MLDDYNKYATDRAIVLTTALATPMVINFFSNKLNIALHSTFMQEKAETPVTITVR